MRCAVAAAVAAYARWSRETPVRRGEILYAVADAMARRRDELAEVVALETGKSPAKARGETDGAVALGRFMAGEGQRLVRPHDDERGAEPLCDDRAPADRRRRPHHRRQHADRQRRLEGVPGAALRQRGGAQGRRGYAAHGVAVRARSRTRRACRPACSTSCRASAPRPARRSSRTGRRGAELHRLDGGRAADRARSREPAGARSALELGGKNPFVVCDDADLDAALKWATLSAFSNAGQRCAAGSRIIVFDAVYDDSGTRSCGAPSPQAWARGRRRLRSGDQRAAAREHARCLDAREGRGGQGAHRWRSAARSRAPRRLLPGADDRREARRRCRDLGAPSCSGRCHAVPRDGLRGARSRSRTTRPTA